MPQTQAAASQVETLRETGDYDKLTKLLPNDWQQRASFEPQTIGWRLLAAELAARRGALDAMKRALLPYLENFDKVPFASASAVLLGCASYAYACGKPQKALERAQQAAFAAQARGDEEARAEAVHLGGRALAKMEKFDEAIEGFRRALALYSEQARPYRMGLVNLCLGVALHRTGRAEEAQQTLERSVKLLSKSHDEYSLALARFHIAQALRVTGDAETAQQYLRFALETFEAREDRHLHATLNELAATLLRLKEYADAGRYLGRALEMSAQKRQESWRQRAKTRELQARLHIARHEFETAEAQLQRARELARLANDRLEDARCLRTFGRLRLAQKREGEAEEFLDAALERAEDVNEPLLEWEVKLLLAQAVCESNPVEAFKLTAEVETRLRGRALGELKKEAKVTRRRLNALDEEHYFILSDARLPSLGEARVGLLKWLWARSLYKAKGNARKAAAILGVTPTYIRRLTKVIPRDLLKPRKKR